MSAILVKCDKTLSNAPSTSTTTFNCSRTNNKTTEADANLDEAVRPVLLVLEGGHHDIASEHGHKGIAFRLEVH